MTDEAARRNRRHREHVGRVTIYLFFIGNLGIIAAALNGLVPELVAVLAGWLSGLAMLGIIRRVEADVHPDLRAWWTVVPAVLGLLGLLAWLRHLDREH